MALRNNPDQASQAAASAAAAAKPPFEDMEDSNTATEQVSAPASAPAPAPAAAAPAPSASREVATQATGAVALALGKKDTALDKLEGQIDLPTLESLGFGAFPRITVDQGGFSENKTKFLGGTIEVEVMSWNRVTLITTGEKDNKEADK